MNMLDTYNLRPVSKVYRIKTEQLKTIYEDILEKRTGVDVKLEVGCYDEHETDTYVKLENEYEARLSDEDFDKLTEVFNPEEWFISRDLLQSILFGTEDVWSFYDEESDEFIFELPSREECKHYEEYRTLEQTTT